MKYKIMMQIYENIISTYNWNYNNIIRNNKNKKRHLLYEVKLSYSNLTKKDKIRFDLYLNSSVNHIVINQ